MWTNTSGKSVPEKDFNVNHFVVLMPLSIVDADVAVSFDSDCLLHEDDSSFGDNIWNVIDELTSSPTLENLTLFSESRDLGSRQSVDIDHSQSTVQSSDLDSGQ